MQYATRCHHCHLALEDPSAFVPCLECTQPRYCSERCRADSWDGYHRHECGALDLLDSAGVAHLALRAVLVAVSSSARPRGGAAAAAAADAIRELRPFADRRTMTLPKNSNVAGVEGFSSSQMGNRHMLCKI